MVLESRKGSYAATGLDLFLQRAAVEIVPLDVKQLALARAAFRRYGKGRHTATLRRLLGIW